MWFTWDYHVTPPYSRIQHTCESGWCIAIPKWCVVTPITRYAASCAPQKALDVYQTLSLLEGGVWERDYLSIYCCSNPHKNCQILISRCFTITSGQHCHDVKTSEKLTNLGFKALDKGPKCYKLCFCAFCSRLLITPRYAMWLHMLELNTGKGHQVINWVYRLA